MRSLFITGFSGFIGSNLISRIDPRKYRKVYGLGRTQPAGPVPENFQFVKGCICDSRSYARYLDSCETVIHLAAATGKAGPDEYFKVNARGTEKLIEQSQLSGVRNFLHLSTIAVKFADKTRYHYAQSKEQGEQAVRNSLLNYAIVRPTIVIGKEAAIWKTFSSLAKRPVLLMVGNGETQIQPIYIEDLIDCLLTILNCNYFSNEIFELGGPEKITFEHLLKRIHHLYHGKEPSVVHLPLKLLSATFSLLEKGFYSALPINAGQLSAFNNDGTIEMNRLFSVSAPNMKDVDAMLEQVVPMSNRADLLTTLEHECIAFSRYLLKQSPGRYVIDKYRAAHARDGFPGLSNPDVFGKFLLRISSVHPALAKLVDCYTSIFLKSSAVRQKWILLLAIMESCPPSHEHFDSPDSSNRSLFFARMIWQGVVFITLLCVSVIVFLPLRLTLAIYSILIRRK